MTDSSNTETDSNATATNTANTTVADGSASRTGSGSGIAFSLAEFIGSETTIERPSVREVFGQGRLASRHWLGIAALAALVLFPVLIAVGLVDDLIGFRLANALFFATFVISWDVVSGYTGEISFGHALFYGVGGYTSGILNIHLGLDPLVTIPLGVIAAALAGLLIGFPALRLEGPYFALITLIVPIVLARSLVLFPAITGGANGLISADAPRIVQQIVVGAFGNYYLALGVFLVGLFVSLAVTRSSAGNVLTAIRADETAVSASGLNPAKFKILAFVLGGAIGGLAGAVYVHTGVGGATPGLILSLILSIEVIIAAILGGMGTITGAAVGGLFFFLLRTALRNVEAVIPVLGVPVGELYFLIFAVITLGFIFFLPQGIVPALFSVGRDPDSEAEGDREGGGGEELSADGGRTPLERITEKFARELRELLSGRER